MRPPEFTGGNEDRMIEWITSYPCFNEAAGIHRRKHPSELAAFDEKLKTLQ